MQTDETLELDELAELIATEAGDDTPASEGYRVKAEGFVQGGQPVAVGEFVQLRPDQAERLRARGVVE